MGTGHNANRIFERHTPQGQRDAQGFHALAAARHRTERYASFAANPDLALTIGPTAAAWAAVFLASLRAHRPRRSQDPNSAEPLAIAASWLSFSPRATTHLKIHRNTLTARLTLIQELLGLDLDRLPDRAALALALRTTAGRGFGPLAGPGDVVFGQQGVQGEQDIEIDSAQSHTVRRSAGAGGGVVLWGQEWRRSRRSALRWLILASSSWASGAEVRKSTAWEVDS
ncbi:helix-turn-helix domain-containing protein [Streptomyces sp. NPDC020096]